MSRLRGRHQSMEKTSLTQNGSSRSHSIQKSQWPKVANHLCCTCWRLLPLTLASIKTCRSFIYWCFVYQELQTDKSQLTVATRPDMVRNLKNAPKYSSQLATDRPPFWQQDHSFLTFRMRSNYEITFLRHNLSTNQPFLRPVDLPCLKIL